MSNRDAIANKRTREFEELVIEQLDSMYSAALGLTRNRADAQDVVQEAVIRALRFHKKFKKGTYIRAWLLTIVRNTFINEYRKRARRPKIVEWTASEEIPSMSADSAMGYYPEILRTKNVLELLDDTIRGAIDALPESHRKTVIMADLQDRSYKEIASELDCPLGTVMSRLHRGRRLLREHLGPAYRPKRCTSGAVAYN